MKNHGGKGPRVTRGRFGRAVFVLLAGAVAVVPMSCNRGKSSNAESGSRQEDRVEPAPGEAVVAPLPPATLGRVGGMAAFVKLEGQPERPGILLEGASGSGTGRRYLVICEAPPEAESASVAFRVRAGIEKSVARRISTLPSGLAVFDFPSRTAIACSPLLGPVAGETFHAIRLAAEGKFDGSEESKLTAELAEIEKQIQDLEERRNAARRQLSEAMRNGGDHRALTEQFRLDSNATFAELQKLSDRRLATRAGLSLTMASVGTLEISSARSMEALDSAGDKMDGALLASSAGHLVAIRAGGKWHRLAELAGSGDRVDSVSLGLSGGMQSIQLRCTLKLALPTAGSDYWMVATTTMELEGQGSGTLEERLSAAEQVSFASTRKGLYATRRIEWNGRPTTLWLKVFKGAARDQPVLDEVILLDYPGRFFARWGKPPSPLVELGTPPPDTPEDLVKERGTLEAKGQVMDLVAAGDGSVVLCRTDQAPFWIPLDLKTGRWGDVPWKANPESLAATQAGKVYLADPKTRILEIWGLASGKKEGTKLLPVEGRIRAIAAPLTDAGRPLFVATDRSGYLLDPLSFERLPAAVGLESFFNSEAAKRSGRRAYDSGPVYLRASDDGVVYSICGGREGSDQRAATLVVDSRGGLLANDSGQGFLGSRGRNLAAGYPDHGGGALRADPVPADEGFPGPAGEIQLLGADSRNAIAVLASPPVLPADCGRPVGKLAPDRGIYFDSTHGVALLPDADKIHILRLNLPRTAPPAPKFLMAGEAMEIPLPPGSGHKLTRQGGEPLEEDRFRVGQDSIRWIAPEVSRREQVSFNLEWTGELGTTLTQSYRIDVMPVVRDPVAVSPDGTKSIPLRMKVLLSGMTSGIAGFAGSGTVALGSDGDSFTAWNVETGENLIDLKKRHRFALGDADRAYLLDHAGNLSSYDLLSGKPLAEANLGDKVQSIATGMSSRGDLLAVEQEGVEGFLIRIPRDGLKPVILDLPVETRRHLFIPQLAANPSGSLFWSRHTAILRDAGTITVKPCGRETASGLISGVPDAAGRFVVGMNGILSLASDPPVMKQFVDLPGIGETREAKLDQSGRYLLIPTTDDAAEITTVSVREAAMPTKEILKLRHPRLIGGQTWIVGNTGTLILWQEFGGLSAPAVYGFAIPELVAELAR